MEELDAALANYRPLPAKETLLLIRRVQKHHAYWRQAQKTLVLRNLRLITKIAIAWHRKFQSNVVTFDDLVQQAKIGYLNAIDKYDPRRGVQFSTYAVTAMNRELERYIDDCAQDIRVSVHLSKRRRRRHRAAADLRQTLGRSPTTDEVAQAMDLPSQKVARLDNLPVVAFSLDEPFGEDGQADRHDKIAALPPIAPIEGQTADAKTLVEFVERVLPTRDAKIVLLYFGLHPSSSDRLSYREIAQLYGCSVLSIKRAVAGALKLLRLPLYAGDLANLLKE